MKKPSEESPPDKIITVVFFKEESGSEPVRKWLKSLTKPIREIIGNLDFVHFLGAICAIC